MDRPAISHSQFQRGRFLLAGVVAVAFGLGWLGCWWFQGKARTDAVAAVPQPAAPAAKTASTPRVEAPTPEQIQQLKQELNGAVDAVAAGKGNLKKAAETAALFKRIAKDSSVEDALRQALALPPDEQWAALQALVNAWTGKEPPGGVLTRQTVTELSRRLLTALDVPEETAQAWLKAFANHPARSAMVESYAQARLGGSTDPQKLMAMADAFTPWERDRFRASLLEDWAERDGAAALAWAWNENSQATPAMRQMALELWALRNVEAAQKQFAAATDPAERAILAGALGRAMAERGTKAAIEWADSLQNQSDREAAHEAIYKATPRGIGAVMSMNEGFPVVTATLPGSAAASAGLLPGDRIVEITGPNGEATPLFGKEMLYAVEHLRGEPGETARLRVIRTDPNGRLVEQYLNVTRQQLIFESQAR